MKVILISPYGSLVNTGLRVLSACLLQAGHETRLIFLPSAKETASFLLFDPSELYSDSVLEQVSALCADADLIGITVMTNYFYKAKQLTEALRQRVRAPIIWGGIHPTVCPEESLEYADLVCIGEGEQALVELVNRLAEGKLHQDIDNLWFKAADGTLITSPTRPLIQNLDTLPFPDFGPENHYILHEGRVRPLTPALLHFYLLDASATGQPVYPLLATRGCPHRCNYCANDAYVELYDKWRHVRRRSNASLIAEIQAIRKRFPAIREIAFLDDVFVAAPTRVIQEFAQLYKDQVGLPFYIIVSPLTINEPKLLALLDAGLVRVSMGIETGSQRIQKLYARSIGNQAIINAASLIHKYSDRLMPPAYDVITDNPYEKIEDQLETLALLSKIPHPYGLLMFSLIFYPGTALYERALREGLIKDKAQEIYNRNYFKLQPTFYNFVIYGYHRRFPTWLLNILINKLMFTLLNSPQLRPLWDLGNRPLMHLRVWHNQRRLKRFRSRPELLVFESTIHNT